MWHTIGFDRTVVGVARTVTSATRLLDALELLRPDPRVSIVFAFDRRSVFSDGVLDLFEQAGASVVPWESVGGLDCDLIVSASENVDAAPAGVPLLVLPHGVGFHKWIPTGDPGRPRLSGLVPDELHDAPTLTMAVAHPDQVDQLAEIAPRAAGRAVVTGDLAAEQLIAGGRLRARYRRALRCADGRRLVVLSSTWGTRSQFGSWSGLAARLAGALPADEYVIAQVLHPNIWASLGGYRVRSQLGEALDAGALLIAPEQGWQAALVAADLVLGDHGSVTFYAAALDKPVVLAGFGEDDIAAGTPMAELGRTAPRLVRRGDVHAQIAAAFDTYRPGRFAKITGRALRQVEPTGELLRQTMYKLLDLDAPRRPTRLRAAPDPRVEQRPVYSYAVYSWTTEVDGRLVVGLRRYPATLEESGSHESPYAVRHLIASMDEPDERIAQSAAVLVCEQISTVSEAQSVIEIAFGQYPGCTMVAAAVAGGCVVGVRDDERRTVLTQVGSADTLLLGSAAYALMRAGLLHVDGTRAVALGDRSFPFDVRDHSEA